MRTFAIPFLFLLGCDAQAPATPPATTPVFEDTWTHANPGEKGPATLTPDESAGKEARRMTVDQLRRSIPALFGGITWTVPLGAGGAGQAPAFDVLSRTLGEADYIELNENNDQPSALFAKYMDDMAGDVCTKGIEHVMVLEDVDDNLRYLRLKLHGIHVESGSMDGLEDLKALYDGIAAEADARTAWFGVCVAMLTAPEMMAY